MSGVTEEMVVLAAEAIHNLRYSVMVAATQEIPRTWAEVVAKEPYHRAYMQRIRNDARAALAAVVPPIEARERERCAIEAEGAGQGRAGTIIAAAIRARTGETT